MLIQAQLGELILEGRLNLKVSDGRGLYPMAKNGQGSDEAVPLETLIENVRSAKVSKAQLLLATAPEAPQVEK